MDKNSENKNISLKEGGTFWRQSIPITSSVSHTRMKKYSKARKMEINYILN